nr:aminotransferase class V-fold PLP-dependent enzyme [bacterium]
MKPAPDAPLYLDTNATTPLDPRVAEAMLPYLHEHFGNPSSGHAYGRTARAAVDRARAQLSDLLGCEPDEVVFTSGGSESNNWAIKGAAWARESRGRHLVISAVEHPATTAVFGRPAGRRRGVSGVPVGGPGPLDPPAAAEGPRPPTPPGPGPHPTH